MRRAFEPRSGKFSLAVAMNLKEAKEYLAKSTPDLLIADLHLLMAVGQNSWPLKRGSVPRGDNDEPWG